MHNPGYRHMTRLPLIAIALFLLTTAAATHADVNSQAERQRFIERMVSEHGFEREGVASLIDGASLREDILEAVKRPAEARPWYEYYPIFLTPERVRGGVKFWQENTEVLARAEEEFGVPAEIIVAIIGVETSYGSYTGRYRIVDALTTLGFEYPPRGEFFLRELEQFLLLAREQGMDPAEVRGSYAGAMGMPQFISSSYRHYAVDFNGDGRTDLWRTHADIIGSVANYFAAHGWEAGAPIVAAASRPPRNADKLDTRTLEPEHTLRDLHRAGLRLEEDHSRSEKVTLIALEQPDNKEYWVGFRNFYVITRYNRSKLYAMATYLLSEQIREQKEAQDGA